MTSNELAATAVAGVHLQQQQQTRPYQGVGSQSGVGSDRCERRNREDDGTEEDACDDDCSSSVSPSQRIRRRRHSGASNGMAAPKLKLSVVLPQNQKSLVTPNIFASDSTAAAASMVDAHTPSHLFSSLVQLNGQEVSLFTGLPSCTPTSADCLASSTLASINPFFWGVPAFDASGASGGLISAATVAAAANAEQQHTDRREELNGSRNQQQQQPQATTVNGNSNKANPPQQVNNNNVNYLSSGRMQQAVSDADAAKANQAACAERRHHLSKLSLDQLHAANAMILSPLTFLLSPEQESWLRFANFQQQQQQQQHHPYATRSEPAANNCNISTQAQDLTNHQHHQHQSQQQSLRQQNISSLAATQDSHASTILSRPHATTVMNTTTTTATPSYAISNTAGSHQVFGEREPAQQSATTAPYSGPKPQSGGNHLQNHRAPVNYYDRHPRAQPSDTSGQLHQHQPTLHYSHNISQPTISTGQQLAPQGASTACLSSSLGPSSDRHQQAQTAGSKQSSHSIQEQQQQHVLVMRNTGQTSTLDPRSFVEMCHQPQQQQQVIANQTQHHMIPNEPMVGIPHRVAHPLREQLYVASQNQQNIYNVQQSANPVMIAVEAGCSGTNHVSQRNECATSNAEPHCAIMISEPVAVDAPPPTAGTKVAYKHDTDGYPTSRRRPLPSSGTNSARESSSSSSGSGASSSCDNSRGSSLNVSPARHYHEQSADTSRDTIDVMAPVQSKSSERLTSQPDRTIVLSPRLSIDQASIQSNTREQQQQPSQVAAGPPSTDQNGEVPVKKKSKGGRKKKIITHEELITRKNRSKERNRVAAKRCRQKRKQFLDELRGRIDDLNELNAKLQKENSMLKGELELLKKHRQHHNRLYVVDED